MITTSNSLFEWRGSGAPHQVDGDLLHTMDVDGLPRVRTELPQLLVIPSSAPHPVQAHRELARHRHLRDATFATHRQVHVLASPVLIGTYRGPAPPPP